MGTFVCFCTTLVAVVCHLPFPASVIQSPRALFIPLRLLVFFCASPPHTFSFRGSVLLQEALLEESLQDDSRPLADWFSMTTDPLETYNCNP